MAARRVGNHAQRPASSHLAPTCRLQRLEHIPLPPAVLPLADEVDPQEPVCRQASVGRLLDIRQPQGRGCRK